MALIDHTRFFYKNGIHEDEPDSWEFIPTDNYSVFYNRDGGLYKIVDNRTNKVYDEFDRTNSMIDFTYENRHIHMYFLPRFIWRPINSFVELFKKRVYHSWYYRFINNDIEVYSYFSDHCCATFVFENNNSHVIFGGYGHYANPYTHFMHRGYGKAFEDKMTKECYRWLCENVFYDDILNRPFEENDATKKKYYNLLRFTDYWDMTEDERKAYETECAIKFD